MCPINTHILLPSVHCSNSSTYHAHTITQHTAARSTYTIVVAWPAYRGTRLSPEHRATPPSSSPVRTPPASPVCVRRCRRRHLLVRHAGRLASARPAGQQSRPTRTTLDLGPLAGRRGSKAENECWPGKLPGEGSA